MIGFISGFLRTQVLTKFVMNKTDKKEKNNKRSNPLFLQIIILILIAVQGIFACILEFKLIKMGIIPMPFLIIAGVLVLALELLLIYAFVSKKLIMSIIFGLLSLIVSAVLIYLSILVLKSDRLMNTFTNAGDKESVRMCVYVRKEDTIQNISELSGEKLGYSANDDTSLLALGELNKICPDITPVEEKSNVSALISLSGCETRAIVMNSSFLQIIGEEEGYENIVSQVRELYSFTIEVERKPSFNDSDDSDAVDYLYTSGDDTFVVYITGVDTWDAASGRNRSDVNLIAVVNRKTNHVQLINTPRDYYLYMPAQKSMDKLTHCGLYGINCSQDVLERLYRVKIDYFVRINFTCFEQIIDSIGGIDIYSEYDFTVEPIKHYTVGYNHCTGKESLAFARERYALEMGDFQRGNNQMEVIKAFVKKVTSPEVLVNYDKLYSDLEGNIITDIPSEMIYDLMNDQIKNRNEWNIESYTVMGTPDELVTYTFPDDKKFVLIPNMDDVEEATRKMGNVLTE